MTRNGRWILLTAILVGLLAVISGGNDPAAAAGDQTQREVIFSDTFAQADGPPSAKWSAFSGHWFVKGGTLHQDNSEYDYGLSVSGLFLRCDYRIECKVRLVNGGAGAGFFWNIQDPKTGENSNMIRCNGKGPLLYGHTLRDQFVDTPVEKGNTMTDGKWHRMRLDVTNSKGVFDFYWDDQKVVDAAKMHYRSGYVALEDSLGYAEYDDLTISVAKGTEWRAEPKFVAKTGVSDVTATSAVVTWQTGEPMPTKVWVLARPYHAGPMLPADCDQAKVYGDGKKSTSHRVELADLNPGCEYAFSVTVSNDSEAMATRANPIESRFVTLPPKGMMQYREVPVAVLCYANVTHENVNKDKDPNGNLLPAQPPTIRDDAWFQSIIDSHEAMRYFYWTNSFFHLDVKCKYLFVTRAVDFSQLTTPTKEIGHDLEVLAKREGLEPSNFGAVITVGGSGTYAYPWPTTPWPDGKLNYTTGCCFVWGDLWISTHEFHHLSEGWMSQAGVKVSGPGVVYAHADQPWRHDGRFGENFDYLGHSLRDIPSDVYWKLSVGRLMYTADKDGDGVPDNDPALVADEKRFDTSPTDKFSYKNGLDDLQNVTAELFSPAVKGLKNPMLKERIDFKYPFAVFDYGFERPKKTPTIDGTIAKGEWTPFASTPNANTTPKHASPIITRCWKPVEGADYHMQTYLNWDDKYLYFAFEAPMKFSTSVELDCNADGYFHGNDNPRMGFSIPRDETAKDAPKLGSVYPIPAADPKAPMVGLVGVMVWNNVEPVLARGVPEWTNDRFPKENLEKIKWAWNKTADGKYMLEVAIPRTDVVGLTPAANKQMGVRFWMNGYLPPTEKNPDPRYSFEMFDSCEYGQFKLVDNPSK